MFDEAVEISKNPKSVSNWIMSDIAKILNEKEPAKKVATLNNPRRNRPQRNRAPRERDAL